MSYILSDFPALFKMKKTERKACFLSAWHGSFL
jgi:hypothetical protein